MAAANYPSTIEANSIRPLIKSEEREQKKKIMILSLFVCSLGNLLTGHILGFSAVLIPKLPSNVTENIFDTSAIASGANLAQIFGALFGGFASGAIGRKLTITIYALIVALGWMLIGFSQGNVVVIILGRICTGFGIMTSVVQVYLSEICPVTLRGPFGASGPIFVSSGLLLVYIEGTYVFQDWRWICLLNAILSLLVASLTFFFLPESPQWLQYRVEKRSHLLTDQSNFLKPSTLKPLALILSIFFTVQMSGFNAILAFAVSICRVEFNFTSDIPVIVIGLMRLLGGILGLFLLPRLPRKFVFISTAILASICWAVLALITPEFTRDNNGFKNMVVIVLISVNLICCGAGVGAIPWFLAGELTPTKIRGFISGCAICMAYFSSFISIFSFEYSTVNLGISFTFWTYAFFSCSAAVIFAVFLPETKNLTEVQIENLFKPSSNKDITDSDEENN